MIKCLIEHTYTYTYITDQLITRPITLVIFSKYLPKFFYSKQILLLFKIKRDQYVRRSTLQKNVTIAQSVT